MLCTHPIFLVTGDENSFNSIILDGSSDESTLTDNTPREMLECACGKNKICPSCGYGWGDINCDCTQGE